jgi:aspartate-semialdehyde dehydrogenase
MEDAALCGDGDLNMAGWNPSVAVVGATGAVGREMLTVLEQYKFPHGELRALASAKSAGTSIPYRGGDIKVAELTAESLRGVDIALFSAGSGISKQFAPAAAKAGTIVIDNSSAFRMDDGVPLVVPEVNEKAARPLIDAWKKSLAARRARGDGLTGGIVANPNCSAIIMLVALNPLRDAFGIERVFVSTYQAASGAGAKGMDELEAQTRDVLAGKPAQPKFFQEPYAFNLFSHNTAVNPETGLNVEEQKMIEETWKIWGDRTIGINPTCIRVPVMRAHSESISVKLKKAATLEQVRAALSKGRGIMMLDDRAGNRFPTPLKASGGDDVLVGRIRPDPSAPHGENLWYSLFVAGDQLRKGAAQNAVQIAQMFVGEA